MRSEITMILAIIGSAWIFAFCIHLWPDAFTNWYAVPATISAIFIWVFIVAFGWEKK